MNDGVYGSFNCLLFDHAVVEPLLMDKKLNTVCTKQVRIIYILSVYSPFSDRVGLPLHNTPFPGVLMKSIGAVCFRPDAIPDVNHMRGMQY